MQKAKGVKREKARLPKMLADAGPGEPDTNGSFPNRSRSANNGAKRRGGNKQQCATGRNRKGCNGQGRSGNCVRKGQGCSQSHAQGAKR